MAISAASYGAGNRIYNGGSNAPTRGTVDPMGYIDRGLNNPSTSRSGIAQSALRRMGGSTDRAANMERLNAYNTSSRSQDGATAAANTTGGYGSSQPIGVSPTGRLQPRPTGSLAQGTITGSPGTFSNALAPGSNANTTGRNPNGTAAQGGTALPYDGQAADEIIGLEARDNRFQSDYAASTQELERQFLRQQRDIDLQRPDATRSVRENFAGRGLAYSSGYAHEATELNNDFARALSDLLQDKTQGGNELNRQRDLWGVDKRTLATQIQNAGARRLAQQAADLELGVTPPPVAPPTGGVAVPVNNIGYPTPPAYSPSPVNNGGGGSGGGGGIPPQNSPSNPNPPSLPGGNSSPFRRPGARTNQMQGSGPTGGSTGGTGQPGATVSGAPARGTAGSFQLHGQTVHVNTAGIIDTPGPSYGMYPAQVRAPGVAAAGAPPLGQRGSMVINGQAVTVNEKGIIDSQGPYYGIYPTQAQAKG